MNEKNCFVLPNDLFNPEFSEYSNQAKLLFAIALSETETARSLMELSDIIRKLGDRKIASYLREIKKSADTEV